MRAVLQRVTSARVLVDGVVVGQIGRGLVVFAGIAQDDADADLDWVAGKVADLRLFADDAGQTHFARSVVEIGGAALVVPQFTLLGDARKGRRPSFDAACRPPEAEALFDRFVDSLRARRLRVETGRFGAMMRVEVAHDGPVTILLDSAKTF